MIRRQTRRGIILLALLAALTWLLARPGAETTGEKIGELDTRLNYALYDFSGRLLNVRGEVNLEIESPRLSNDAQSGIGIVDLPQIRIQQENERWHITAESAIITADREQVTLIGDVHLTKRDETSDQLLEIQTRDVMLNVTPRTASTQSPVTIWQAGDRLDAKGMNLDLITDSYELLSDVRAHYEVP